MPLPIEGITSEVIKQGSHGKGIDALNWIIISIYVRMSGHDIVVRRES